jgi:hypothetical protein
MGSVFQIRILVSSPPVARRFPSGWTEREKIVTGNRALSSILGGSAKAATRGRRGSTLVDDPVRASVAHVGRATDDVDTGVDGAGVQVSDLGAKPTRKDHEMARQGDSRNRQQGWHGQRPRVGYTGENVAQKLDWAYASSLSYNLVASLQTPRAPPAPAAAAVTAALA